jgi:hypothetical protein
MSIEIQVNRFTLTDVTAFYYATAAGFRAGYIQV